MKIILLQASNDTWTNYQIFNGAGDLNPWASIAQISLALLMVGFAIRGVVLLAKLMTGNAGDVGKVFFNFFIAFLAFVVMTFVISGGEN